MTDDLKDKVEKEKAETDEEMETTKKFLEEYRQLVLKYKRDFNTQITIVKINDSPIVKPDTGIITPK